MFQKTCFWFNFRSGLKGLLGKTVPNEKPLQKSENFKQILEEDSILKQVNITFGI